MSDTLSPDFDIAAAVAAFVASAAPPAPEVPRLAYSIEETLQAVPIGRTKLFELIATGQLRTISVGRRRLIPVDALAALVSGAA